MIRLNKRPPNSPTEMGKNAIDASLLLRKDGLLLPLSANHDNNFPQNFHIASEIHKRVNF